jgi:retron-type reverse transcriptase
MKRAGQLFETICSFQNLLLAARRARRGKSARPSVAGFHLDLETEIFALRRELASWTYRPGPYHVFWVREPVLRMISAAPYRDRVVHHALMNVLQPVLERGFVTDSFACRRGKGTHRALARCRTFSRQYGWVLRADIRKYFPSIDHAILLGLVERKIKDRRVLDLVRTIVEGANPQEPAVAYFPQDTLFTPWERRRGIPIGNLTSQIFANVYLDPLDHFVKERLGCPAYLRYCDDFCLFHDDPAWLGDARERIEAFLAGLRLRLNPVKTMIHPVDRGVAFVGFRIWPEKVLLNPDAVRRFRRRLGTYGRSYARGVMSADRVRQGLVGWIGHARHADTWRLRTRLLSNFRLVPRRGAPRDVQPSGGLVEQ